MATSSIGRVSAIRVEHGPVTAVKPVQRRNAPEQITGVSNKKQNTKAAPVADNSYKERLKLEADYKTIQRDADGDTLSITREGARSLEKSEGRVRSAAERNAENITSDDALKAKKVPVETEKEPVETAEETADSKGQSEITSYAGIANDALYNYYLEGRISKADYDQEIARREELQSTASGTSEDKTGQVMEADRELDQAKALESGLEKASPKKGADGLRGAERLDAAIKAAEGQKDQPEKNAEEEKARITA